MDSTELTYDLESWEYDFLVKHFLSNEEILHYSEDEKELIAETERNDSTVYFHTRRDNNITWFSVLSMNEGEELGEEYLESMVERRLESIYRESRETLGIDYNENEVEDAVAGI
jgi:hypothetical protein